ncbi:MAG: hypothetical protein L7W40_15230 [Akkermansiaceae bacterium]|nr:hypothetical protein [Akkermansiaceae bacterium]
MKLLLTAFLSLILSAFTQELPNDREKILEALLNAPDRTSLDQAIKAGKAAGLPDQLFLEARFVFLVNEDDRVALATLSSELEAHLPKFSPDDTMLFAVKEDFASIVQYTKALAALQNNDTTLFKKHITEAFWLAPSHATQFAPLIDDMRINEAMKKITLDLNLEFEDQRVKGESKSLKAIAGGSPAFLIHFWSPWASQAMAIMDEFQIISGSLIKNNIPVASILLSSTTEARRAGDDLVARKKQGNTAHWLVDTEKFSLGSLMRVSSFPTVVLVSNKGKILFNGDPANRRLWEILTAINPEITEPTINAVLPKRDPKGTSRAKNGN